jgi:transposase
MEATKQPIKEVYPMRLKDYARNPRKRKEYVQQPGLLLIGVDISKAKHDACIGTRNGIITRKLTFAHCREGFQMFEKAIRKNIFKAKCRRVLIGMEPSGIYWYALYERLKSCGYGVCLVNCQAVSNNRKTMSDGRDKTDEKDAYSIFDLLTQGKFLLPVQRDSELMAAYRMMQRHMALKKRISRLRNQLRQAIHLAFPELNPLIKDLTLPTSLRFLQANPAPRSIRYNGRRRFMEKWRPRQRCGQWRPEKLERIYELAGTSIGLKDPHRINEFEIKALAQDLADAVGKARMWLDKAIELVEHRNDYWLLLQMPRIGKPTACAILTAVGDINEFLSGKQLVKLAGLDIRRFESGLTVKKRPRISHIGSGYLRHWLYHYAKRLVAFDPQFKALHQRKKQNSPGKGSGQRALIAVSDKIIRIVYRILKDNTNYSSKKDQVIARQYGTLKKAA